MGLFDSRAVCPMRSTAQCWRGAGFPRRKETAYTGELSRCESNYGVTSMMGLLAAMADLASVWDRRRYRQCRPGMPRVGACMLVILMLMEYSGPLGWRCFDSVESEIRHPEASWHLEEAVADEGGSGVSKDRFLTHFTCAIAGRLPGHLRRLAVDTSTVWPVAVRSGQRVAVSLPPNPPRWQRCGAVMQHMHSQAAARGHWRIR
jgi:hypothetical protein